MKVSLADTPTFVSTGLTLAAVPLTARSFDNGSDLIPSAWSAAVGGSFHGFLKDQGYTYENKDPLYVPLPGTAIRGVVVIPYVPAQGDEYRAIRQVRDFARRAVSEARRRKVATLAVFGAELLDSAEKSEAYVESALLETYTFDQCRSKQKTPGALEEIVLLDSVIPESSLNFARAVAEGAMLARDIVLLPPNRKKPVELATMLTKRFSDPMFVTKTYDRHELSAMGAGGILGVGQAGDPVLLRVEYTPPNESNETLALVGKGVVMDTGGYCIKPGSSQEDMKGDCAGAAATAGAMLALRGILPTMKVVAYMPLVENLIAGDAYLTSDVLTMLSGTTVEIGNTDAEGRLILADALTLACREGAARVVDLATLTGACVVALGTQYAGLFRNEAGAGELEALMRASQSATERFWELPMPEEYAEQLEGSVADLRNVGGRSGGACLAALFLEHFVDPAVPWVHIDIAGPAIDGISRGMVSGFGVRTLARYIRTHSAHLGN